MNEQLSFAFESVSIGGTFHAMHAGHLQYIRLAFSIGRSVHLQLTSDEFARTLKRYHVKSREEREAQIIRFLKDHHWFERLQMKTIGSDQEVIDLCLTQPIEAAVVEPAYFQMFININSMRAERGMEEMCLLWKPRTKRNNLDLSSTSVEAGRRQGQNS